MSQAANTVGLNQHDRLAGKDDANNQPQSANLPASIAKDLASPDARTRYRALDHWETKEDSKLSKSPLDPVFEAMEDEDEAVRAKATAIVEQYWTAEQEREKG
jgi:hypothetical protein